MTATQKYNPKNYTTGNNRYIRFAQDFLDLRLSEEQKRVLRTVAQNQRTLVWGGNGPGKSFVIAVLKLGYLFTNPDSIVLGTSGSYQQYEDTMWKPLNNMFSDAKDKYGLPGRSKGGNRPILEIDDEWYAKIISPRDPGELEGRHGPDVLVVIDEADKKYVEEQHFDSAGSSITDMNDKLVAICNPPKDETNVVAKKKEDPRWEVIELSAFDSHNAKVDAGIINEPRIPGMTDLITIASDWESYNKRPWPLAEENYPHGDWPGMPEVINQIEDGVITRDEALEWIAPGYVVAKEAHERFETLDERWYIRRAGVMPPEGADTHRPIEPADVRAAWDRSTPKTVSESPRSVGIDVARSGDQTVMIGEHNGELRIHFAERGANHETQKQDVVEGTAISPGLKDWPDPQVAIDRGYAPGFHDYVSDRIPNVVGFQNGTKPVELTRWYDKWAEALFHMGQWLDQGGVINDAELREQLMVAARVVKFSSRTLNSRGKNGAEVFEASSKEKIKEELGHSPDYLDAALMAVWRLRTDPTPTRISSTWYDPHQQA
jgi:hypothetical protein